MMEKADKSSYLLVSIIAHVVILLLFILSVESTTPLNVFENTNKQDVISAVVLGDTTKSKILPNPIVQSLPKPKPEPEPKPLPEPKKIEPVNIKKEVIALKPIKKIKVVELKDLLADFEKQTKKQKKIKEKQLKTQFEKTIREQAEKSMRQQLLDEDIKLKGMQTRQAQGVVNKYKALIVQAISERWIVPMQANKKLYCELMIRLAPGGLVLDVQVTKSSGDPSLDSSARAAVLKASPLPVPREASAFEPFRQFELRVKPENILTSDV
jgi:colicin import membrane protein